MSKALLTDDQLQILAQLPEAKQRHILRKLKKARQGFAAQKAKLSFIDYVEYMWPAFISGEHHRIMGAAFDRIIEGNLKRLIINMPPRHRLALNTPILTTDGWKTMETVEPGDEVFSPNGKPVRVVGKSDVHVEDIYQVTTSDGHVVECDGEHLWTVDTVGEKHPSHQYRALPTRNIKNPRRGGPWLPRHAAIEMPDAELPIDPWVLGVWLGGGTKYGASIGCATKDEPEMRRLIAECGYETSDRDGYQMFGVLGLHQQLRESGLLQNKHIPAAYFTASVAQREALLQGLIDTDGSVGKTGRVTLHQTDRALTEQVCSLINSLGCMARITDRQTHYNGAPSRPSYRINFRHPSAARLDRKARRLGGKSSFRRSISVRKTDRVGRVQCIEVANEDGLFLAGKGFVVTHNTKSEFGSWLLPTKYLGHHPGRKVMQLSHTSDLATDFGRKVRDTINTDDQYSQLYPGTGLKADTTAAGRWKTSEGGEYFALGVGGKLAGKGADLLIIDDPHALHVDTPIATTEGWKTMGTLEIGDEVFGPDGAPTRVTHKSPVYVDRKIYAVTTSDNQTVFADARHLWNVRTSTRTDDPYKNLTTEEMLEPRSSGFMIPRHASPQYPEQDLPIDPWVLGAWLGDGTSSLGRMTAHPSDMSHMKGEFSRRGFETTDLADPFSFWVNGLMVHLRELGVLNNKHIPEAYLTSSYAQRMALLQGLMDTDGNVTRSGQCVFHNKDEALVDQVVELLHSLGRKCQRRSYQTNGKFGSCLMHRVTFKLRDAALMPRKRVRTFSAEDKQHRSITVEDTGNTGSVQCITVERDDGLFLAGRGYVVTHNSEQEYIRALNGDPAAFDEAFEWYQSGPRQRLQPGAAIVVIMTRWHLRDITGRLVKRMTQTRDSDQWEIIEFPALLPSENPVWPEFWKKEELEATREELTPQQWNAQYQQNPTSEGAALVKRDWWQKWEGGPPECEWVIQSWDTAFTAKETSDYSACTTWGVFTIEDPATGYPAKHIILLDAFRGRYEFPELKAVAFAEWKRRQPDAFLVENRASGQSLIQEFRRMGIPVSEFTPSRGNDKMVRLNAITDLFASGNVWYPSDARWAEEVIDEVASFPSGDHDDYVDSATQALHRFRQGGFVDLASDHEDEEGSMMPRVKAAYY